MTRAQRIRGNKAVCKGFIAAVLFGISVVAPLSVLAQGPPRPNEAELSRMRGQISIMEGALKQAIRSGANDLIGELRAVTSSATSSAEGMLLGMPEARGFHLASYGTVFVVQVPRMNGVVVWALPIVAERNRSQAQGQPGQVVGASLSSPAAPPVSPVDPDVMGKLSDLPGAYRRAITTSLIDAMIDHSMALRIPPDEFLTVAASRNTPPDPFDPSDAVRTTTLTVKGSDLDAINQKRLSRDEARKLVVVREE